MNDSLFMRGGQTASNLHGVLDGSTARDCPNFQGVAKCFAFEQFRYNIRRALLVTNVEDRKYVGMIQRGGGTGFLRKSLQAIAIRGERNGQDLNGYSPVEAAIVRAVHL